MGGTDENHGEKKLRLVSEPAKIWTKHLMSYEHYCYTNPSHPKLLNIHEHVHRNIQGAFTAI
jgi:hypothetical protein